MKERIAEGSKDSGTTKKTVSLNDFGHSILLWWHRLLGDFRSVGGYW